MKGKEEKKFEPRTFEFWMLLISNTCIQHLKLIHSAHANTTLLSEAVAPPLVHM